jgi:hypothetical protein
MAFGPVDPAEHTHKRHPFPSVRLLVLATRVTHAP